MYTNSKRFLLISALILLLCSCQNFEQDLNKSINSMANISLKQNSVKILSSNQTSFSLSTGINGQNEYKWYSCNKDKTNAKFISSQPILNTTWSEISTGVKYYYCVIDGKETNVFTVAKTGLPTVIIETENKEDILSKDYDLESVMTILHSNNSIINKDLNKIAIELSGHGNSTWNVAKHSYNVKATKDKIKIFDYSIEDKTDGTERNTKSKKYCLISNSFDRSLLRNYLSSKLATCLVSDSKGTIIGDWTAQMEFVDLVINDKYLGTYLLTEKNRLDKKSRVAIKDIEEEFGTQEKNYGFILEVDARGDAVYKYTSPISGFLYTMCDPDLEETEDAEEIVSWIKDYMSDIETNIYSQNWAKIQEKVDIQSLVNYFIVCELMKNRDSASYSSLYMYRDTSDQKLHYGPIWDFDISSGNDNQPDLYSTDGYHYHDTGWYAQLFQIPEFVQLVKQNWIENKDIIYGCISADLEDTYKRIETSADLNFIVWDDFGTSMTPTPPHQLQRTSVKDEFEYLQNWLKERFNWLDSQISTW